MTVAAAVHRIRLPARLAVAPARSAFERWLSGLSLLRYGLPADAIVLVHRLRAPYAALMAAQGAHADPLAGALREAVRPAQQAFVPAGAPAVWFADEAELLACLARDALGGALGQRWWWRLLCGCTPARPDAVQRWAAAPQLLPQALFLLAQQTPSADRAWLEEVGRAGRLLFLQVLARSYPVCGTLQAALAASEDGAAPGDVDPPARRQPTPDGDLPVGVTDVALQPAPDAAPAPLPPALVLLRLMRALRVDAQAAIDRDVLRQLFEPIGAPAPDIAPAASAVARDEFGAFLAQPETVVQARESFIADPLRHELAAKTAADDVPRPGDGSPEQPVVPSSGTTTNAPDTERPTPRQEPAPLPRPRSPPSAAERVPIKVHDTQFGGLFFLLNVALSLGWYGDFTQPLQRGLPVSPWRFLHAAGRALIGRAWRADPLATLLLERAPPRAQPEAPQAWLADPQWLLAFVPDLRAWHAVVDPSGILQLWHPAGFVVAQGASVDALPSMLHALSIADRVVVTHAARRFHRAPADPLALLWPLLRARLRVALGLPSWRAAALLTLELPARVHAAAARLDVHFPLCALPLPLRLAGLDRDPGWVPAAGCDFRFHFD